MLYHLAAIYSLWSPHPERIYEVNVEGTKSVLWAAYKAGLRRVVHKLTRDTMIGGMEGLGSQSLGGFSVSFSASDHVASSFVELSMLTGDGRVRT